MPRKNIRKIPSSTYESHQSTLTSKHTIVSILSLCIVFSIILTACGFRTIPPEYPQSITSQTPSSLSFSSTNAPNTTSDSDTPVATSTSDSSNPPSWTDYPTIAHALGSVDGRKETNSKDALMESYDRGQRVFEVDLQLTSDGHLVCRHDWDQTSYYNLEQEYAGVMDYSTFRQTPICYYYTPIDITDLLLFMRKNPDMYIVTDTKETSESKVREEMRCLREAVENVEAIGSTDAVELAETADNGNLWDRIIVQIYNDEMYDWVSDEVPVTNWIYTLYQIADPDYDEIGQFCAEHNIPIVTMATERASAEHSKILHSYGLKVYVHTVNRLKTMKEMSWIVDGFYTDYVTPSEFDGVKRETAKPHLQDAELVLLGRKEVETPQ